MTQQQSGPIWRQRKIYEHSTAAHEYEYYAQPHKPQYEIGQWLTVVGKDGWRRAGKVIDIAHHGGNAFTYTLQQFPSFRANYDNHDKWPVKGP